MILKIGLFCEEKEDLAKIKNFTLEIISKNKETITKIIPQGGYGFDIFTDKAKYIIRLAEQTSRACKLHDVYYCKITDKSMLDILYFTLTPLDLNDVSWRSKSHFVCIDELI